MTREQQAICMVADAVTDAVAAAGERGAPGGVLYAAMMHHGFTLDQFNNLMGALVEVGRLRRTGHLYHVVRR